jgi:hypothetical protein
MITPVSQGKEEEQPKQQSESVAKKQPAAEEWPDYSATQSAAQSGSQASVGQSTEQTSQANATTDEKPPTLEAHLPKEEGKTSAVGQEQDGSSATSAPAENAGVSSATNTATTDQATSEFMTLGDDSAPSTNIGQGYSLGESTQTEALGGGGMTAGLDDQSVDQPMADLESMRDADRFSEGALPEEPAKAVKFDELETPAKASGFPEAGLSVT